MIYKETQLFVVDNSGALKVKCIGFFKNSPKNSSTVGDFIKVSVQSLKKKGNIKVKKGQVLNAIITSVKKDLGSSYRFNGFSKVLGKNTVVLLNSNNKLIGTRINTPVDNFLRSKLFIKSILLNYNYI
jgi:large subunit ribosomal protein L14